MSNGFSLRPDLVAALASFDDKAKAFDATEVYGALIEARKKAPELSDAEWAAFFAEVCAFGLMDRSESPWRTHFGPVASGTRKNGTPWYSPDIKDTAKGTCAYWSQRARDVVNPILKARYADAVWDLQRAMGEGRPGVDMAKLAINAYLQSVEVHNGELLYQFKAAERALELGMMLRDGAVIATAKQVLMRLHGEAVATKQVWWYAWDVLYANKRAELTTEEQETLVAGLEEMLAHFRDPAPEKFNPHHVQSIVNKLVRHYGDQEQIQRLRRAEGEAFTRFGGMGDGLLGSMVLDTAVTAFKEAGMAAEAEDAQRLLEAKARQARNEMSPITTEMRISNEDMQVYLDQILSDDPGQTLVNIASENMTKGAELRDVLAKLAEEAPLMSMLQSAVMADDRVTARIGSVEEDELGRLIQQAAQGFQLSTVWLLRGMEAATERHKLTTDHLVAWANRADLFADTTLLHQGLQAWFDKDYVKAVHVLVPQVEHGLREMVGKLGKAKTRPDRHVPGVSTAKTMGDILFDKDVTERWGEDLTLHLRALYADPRGWNIRNELAHGLMSADQFGETLALWVVHSVLLLGLMPEFLAAYDKSAPPT